MNNLFECRVKYEVVSENKSYTDSILVEAVNFSDVEQIISKYMRNAVSGEFEITGIYPRHFSDLMLNNEGKNFYSARIETTIVSGKGLKLKSVVEDILIKAEYLEDALSIILNEVRERNEYYVITSIKKTKFFDVILLDKIKSD